MLIERLGFLLSGKNSIEFLYGKIVRNHLVQQYKLCPLSKTYHIQYKAVEYNTQVVFVSEKPFLLRLH